MWRLLLGRVGRYSYCISLLISDSPHKVVEVVTRQRERRTDETQVAGEQPVTTYNTKDQLLADYLTKPVDYEILS